MSTVGKVIIALAVVSALGAVMARQLPKIERSC